MTFSGSGLLQQIRLNAYIMKQRVSHSYPRDYLPSDLLILDRWPALCLSAIVPYIIALHFILVWCRVVPNQQTSWPPWVDHDDQSEVILHLELHISVPPNIFASTSRSTKILVGGYFHMVPLSSPYAIRDWSGLCLIWTQSAKTRSHRILTSCLKIRCTSLTRNYWNIPWLASVS